MLVALAVASWVTAASTFETYVLTVDFEGPVRLVINGVRVDEPIGKRVAIEHYVVPGANNVFIEPLRAGDKAPPLLGTVRLVLGKSDSRSWETADGQIVSKLKRGTSVFTVPQSLREPLWRIGSQLGYDDVTYRAKVNELHALLAAKDVEGYLAQFAEAYAETERLFPMVKADALRDRDASALRALLAKNPVSPLPDDLFFNVEGRDRLMVCMRKRTRETFSIGDTPVLLTLFKVNGALRPYAVIRP